ncbi:MAG: hypothetical protein U0P45_10030 [Acidimicrobiales bacterium]
MHRGAGRLVLVAAVVAVVLCACQPVEVATKPGTTRVVVFGDSMPSWLIRDGAKAVASKPVTLVDGTLAACEGAAADPPARSRSGSIVPTPGNCAAGWTSLYPPHVKVKADVAVVMAGTHAMLDHLLSGTWRHPCHAPFRAWYQADLEGRYRYLRTRASRVVAVLPSWPEAKSQWIMPSDYVKRADCVRSITAAAAKATGTTVVDLGAELCPSGPTAPCRSWRTKDGLHVDAARAGTVLWWLVAQVLPPPASPTTTTTSTTTTSTTTTSALPPA